MWCKVRHYSLKNSPLIQKTDSGNKRNLSYPCHKAPEKGTAKDGSGKRKVTQKGRKMYDAKDKFYLQSEDTHLQPKDKTFPIHQIGFCKA